jgi:hypothetical protein
MASSATTRSGLRASQTPQTLQTRRLGGVRLGSRRLAICALAAAAVLLSACVASGPRARADVRLATADQVEKCQHLGGTVVTVWAGVGPVARVPEAVEDNLLYEARRQAERMGGNTIVRGESAEFGQRSFGIYRCP